MFIKLILEGNFAAISWNHWQWWQLNRLTRQFSFDWNRWREGRQSIHSRRHDSVQQYREFEYTINLWYSFKHLILLIWEHPINLFSNFLERLSFRTIRRYAQGAFFLLHLIIEITQEIPLNIICNDSINNIQPSNFCSNFTADQVLGHALFNIVFFSFNDTDGLVSTPQHEFEMTMGFHKVSNQILFNNNVDIPIEKYTDTNQNRSNKMKTLSLLPGCNIPEALVVIERYCARKLSWASSMFCLGWT